MNYSGWVITCKHENLDSYYCKFGDDDFSFETDIRFARFFLMKEDAERKVIEEDFGGVVLKFVSFEIVNVRVEIP